MAEPSEAGSMPMVRSWSPVNGDYVANIRMVEDLPAPLGPRKPKDSPRRTSTSMPLTASTLPCLLLKALRSPTARIIGSFVTLSTLDAGCDSRHLDFGCAGGART